MVAVPRASLSSFVTGGTSLAAVIVTLNTIGPVFEGPAGLLLPPPHAAAAVIMPAATTIAPAIDRFIAFLLPESRQNFREMLKPRYTSWSLPPRASCPNVVPNELV